MAEVTHSGSVSRKRLWIGRIVSALPVLMLLFSGVVKLIKPLPVVEEFTRLGYPERLAVPIGILELACTILYVIPPTSVLGAILLTAYLGGAVNTHVRIGDPFIGPVIFVILIWLGLWLRDDRLTSLIPLRKPASNYN